MSRQNSFTGTAHRLEDIDLPRLGYEIGVGEDEIHAVIDVECAGSGFDKKGRPRILFERHWFHRLLEGDERIRAVEQGLAVPGWSRATYNRDQYAILEQAIAINEEAALKSASWGMGQIMGFNHKAAGFDTVGQMVTAFMESEANQLEGMISFIRSNNLDDELRRHDWAGFARGYNGSGYRANRYDEKLAAAYRKWSKTRDTQWEPKDEVVAQVRKLKKIARDANKKGLQSSTNMATGAGGLATAVLAAKPVLDAVNETKDGLAGLLDASPWVLVAIIGLGAAFWIWKERTRKAREAREVLE